MNHIKAINGKARRIEAHTELPVSTAESVTDWRCQRTRGASGLETAPPDQPHIPLGCSFVFSPGWEADSSGGTAGLCQPVERDLFDCHLSCFWPAHVPDQLNHAPDWTGKCAAAQKDWRNIDLIFP